MSNNTGIEAWLSSLNHPVAETAFPPRDATGKVNKITAPFIVYLDKEEVSGSDDENFIISHDLTIEYYTKDKNTSDLRELIINSGLEFTSVTSWLATEQLYMTVFELSDVIIEKI